jgi:glutamine synthetase
VLDEPEAGAPRAAGREDALRLMTDQAIEHVRIVTVDMHGVPRSKLVSATRFERVMTTGQPWALALLACDLWEDMPEEETALGQDIGWGNGLLIPDLSTFVKLPWTRGTAQVMADMFSKEMVPQPSPRQVLARVLEGARAAGYEPVFGSELEFYLYRPELGDQGFDRVFGRNAWFSVDALGQTQGFIEALTETAKSMTLPVDEIMSEHGAGQIELNLEPGSGVAAIDAVVTLKIVIKEMAQRQGLRATFLSRPTNLWETPPSGYHLHQTLKRIDGMNAFFDREAGDSLSSDCRHYIGGQIAHAMGMTGIAAPTVTAYKRYIPGTVAPVRVGWGVENRSALVRAIPAGEGTHVENRIGSSDANPYLLAAVCVSAGLDGVANRTDPGPPGKGNMFTDERYRPLPTTLIDGLTAYCADPVLVEALGPEFTRVFAGLIRRDWKRYVEHVSDWEIREYREML